MKTILSILFSIGLFAGAQAQALDRSIRPKAGPAPEVKLGNVQSFVTANGMNVFVVENHKLPVVSYSIDFDIRPELEGDMAGFSSFIGDLLKAGTQKKTKDQFNEELDMLGARLSIGNDGIFMQSLKKHGDKLLSLCAEVLMEPNFSQKELDKLKKQAKSSLASNMDDPEAMSENITSILNFGRKHPYGEVMTEKSVEKITLERCKKYFETYFRPNVAYMAVVGDITLAEAKAQIEKHFGKWAKKTVPVATYPTPQPGKGAAVGIVNKSGAVQSVINITYPINMKPGSPDEIPLKVANGILGGGSTGRLFMNLRETHGWTYGSYSSFNADELPFGGKFSATANSTTSATDSSVAEILKEMNRLRTEKVKPEELEGYKNYMAGVFALGLEDPKTLARYAINERKFKMPKDYYRNYLKNVEAVTTNDVMLAAAKYITPGVAHITVAGDKKVVAEKLKVFGPVTVYDMYGEVQPETTPAAVPSNVSARSVIQKHIDVTGGSAAWEKVKDMKVEMQMEMQGMKISINTLRKAPDKMMVDVNMMGNSLQKIVVNGKTGYMVVQGQKKDFDEKELKQYADEANMSEELGYLSADHKISLKGIEKVDGQDAYLIEVTKPDGDIVMEYYHTQSGLKMKTEKTEDTPEGKETQTTYYLDYREGPSQLKFPYLVKQSGGPMGMMEMNLQKVEVNSGLSDELFK